MLSRRHFLALSSAPLLAQPRPRNILLLIADDLGLHTGAYGDANAHTPQLDRLADEGVRFTNAFCTTASCSAARSVILSGLHNHTNGHYGHAHAEHNLRYLPGVRSAPELLARSGYRTGIIGKLHVNPLSQYAWDLNAEGENRNVRKMADTARSFFLAAGDKPFYLHVGFGDPHRAAQGFGNRDYPGVTARKFNPSRLRVPSFLPDNPPTRAELAEYYEAVHRLDQGVGMVLDALREARQLENTLVVFISDNGIPFPNAKTNCYDAGIHLPMIVRAPQQQRRGMVNHAMVSFTDLLPTFLDYARAEGPDYDLHGRSFLPILEEEHAPGWDKVYFSHTFHEITMYYPMRGVRTRQFKYIRNLFPELEFPHASDLWASATWQSVRPPRQGGKLGQRQVRHYLHRPGEELYDIQADPDEVRNLAHQPAHRPTLLQLREDVHRFRAQTSDPWMILSNYNDDPKPDVKPLRRPSAPPAA
jgi:N-sulfoglucosamine sulfohydrolase